MERKLVVVIGIFSLAVEISLGEGLTRLLKRKRERTSGLAMEKEALGSHPMELDRDKADLKAAKNQDGHVGEEKKVMVGVV